jgi:hypothetical protein
MVHPELRIRQQDAAARERSDVDSDPNPDWVAKYAYRLPEGDAVNVKWSAQAANALVGVPGGLYPKEDFIAAEYLASYRLEVFTGFGLVGGRELEMWDRLTMGYTL